MQNSVCFIGHRKTSDTAQLRESVRNTVIYLITQGKENFIFGDRSEFNTICFEIVTELKEKYPNIKRIHFRKDYENADEYTMRFLSVGYDESICPKGIGKAGKASYVERNTAMIRESEICIFYYDKEYLPKRRKHTKFEPIEYQPKSGTRIAYEYAIKKNKTVINLFCRNENLI